ncbi:aminopeptidase P family protein [Proteiniborus sp. MB09-C3]|uniref:aminopeptidase P family protein n=1 Tax=Proteiniborus sp. MB09-C3 TaxID=3050072 RepID=UPI002556B300|nr:aminopeptidase P family protein [Proteiniborus sp. MB09-C3]WIV10654.1 aminopeptidase P family protein [Proteiniborus sp. MB09-C3]
MNKELYITTRKKIMDNVEDNSLLVLFSGTAPHKSADADYDFIVNKNFFYMVGIEREKFILLIEKRNKKLKETLFIDKVTPLEEKWTGFRMKEDEAKSISGIESIEPLGYFNDYLNSILFNNDYSNLYLDLERRGWDSDETKALKLAKNIRDKYPHININNSYSIIAKSRMVKTTEEIEMIKKAIDITNQGIKRMMEKSKPGMMEYQLEAYFDFELKTLGAKRHSFNTIAASGENAIVLHYGENNCEMKDGDLILFDLGAEYNNYCADISRTFPVNGRFTERQKEIYNIVLKSQLETIKAVKPGLPFKELNNVTKKVLIEECKKNGLIKEDEEIIKYYYHGVSHYLGLDTHDVGGREVNLEPGMVLTIEPGLYIEEEGIGIRIEDNVVVTEDGCENLSKDIIKSVEEIEAFMNK